MHAGGRRFNSGRLHHYSREYKKIMATRKALSRSSFQGGDSQIVKPAHYLEYYEQYFSCLIDDAVTVLELGVFKGDSLEMFADYFSNGLIFGIDANKVERQFTTSRIKFYQGLQNDPALFEKIWQDHALKLVDIVIDDCSHIGSYTLDSFRILFPRLKPGGYYVIEDWGTGYWPKWPGGRTFDQEAHFRQKNEVFKSHQNGMPGFIKQLIDEVGMADITDRRGLNAPAPSLFEFVHVYPGIVFIKKA